MLLHGFPELWYTWRRQLPALAQAGHRAVAVDLRGYNLSSRPPGTGSYGTKIVAGDVARLIEALGRAQADVVGHDWGAGVAWALAMEHAARVRRLAVLNGPHPVRLLAALRRPSQLVKSWYLLFFQLPWLPEVIVRRDRFLLLREGFASPPAQPGAYTEEDIERYVAAWEADGAVRAMLAYYRAMRRRSGAPRIRRIDTPVLAIWGDDDPHLERDLAEPPAKLVPDVRVVHLASASHWVHADQPARVNELLIEHFLRD